MRKVILIGGDTAGHVTPSLALLPSLKEAGYGIHYIGSYQGMEHKLIENAGVRYNDIPSGKPRRYFDIKNFSDPSRVARSYTGARRFLKCHKPDVIFSKGGFVAVPVTFVAKHYKIPVIIHEFDMTPGLANKTCTPSALKACCNLPETLEYLPSDKAIFTGSPIREELLQGDRLSGLAYAHLTANKSVLLIIGESLGSVAVDTVVRNIPLRLLPSHQVIRICGRDSLDESLIGTARYVQYEHVGAPLKCLFAAADLVILRAGTNSICKLPALRKPNLLIPLSTVTSREDRVLNANSSAKQGFNRILEEEASSDGSLLGVINDLHLDRNSYIQPTEQSSLDNTVKTVVSLIEPYVK